MACRVRSHPHRASGCLAEPIASVFLRFEKSPNLTSTVDMMTATAGLRGRLNKSWNGRLVSGYCALHRANNVNPCSRTALSKLSCDPLGFAPSMLLSLLLSTWSSGVLLRPPCHTFAGSNPHRSESLVRPCFSQRPAGCPPNHLFFD